ncbi:MAG TPA: TlpA disulfide reductase family protein, partial [Bryobacteraceae bacterium]|nr:TlpA disulfide reductase family protein [Bryobacteraceae bacterium]
METVKINRFLRAGIALLAVALVYVIYAAVHEHIVEAGDSAPDFTVTTDTGRSVSLSHFGGKLLLLNFWASWCQPCVEETPSLSAFADQYKDKGVVVLGVSVDKDEQAYKKFVERFHPDFLVAHDLKIHEDYGTFVYPETYVIDASGRVLRKYAEAKNWMDPQTLAD